MLSTRTDGKVGLSVLQNSPLDSSGWSSAAEAKDVAKKWRSSRFNVRAMGKDGRMILWNTLTGAISVFNQQQTPTISKLLRTKDLAAPNRGIIEYLALRGYLIESGNNEYRRFLHEFGKQHYRSDKVELILMSSEDCNFRCKYCYEDFARGTMKPEVRRGIKRYVEDKISQTRHMSISWFGGEPLYGWEAVEDLGPFLSNIAREHDIPYVSNMTTNGYLLTEETVDKLFDWRIKSFQITLDGMPDNHDCSRPGRDGSGTFWTIFNNLKSMAARPDDFSVTLRVNFDNENYSRIDEFSDLVGAAFKGDSRFKMHFHAVGRWGGDNDENLDICGSDEQDDIMREMKRIAAERGLEIETLGDYNRLGSQVCYAARPYNLLIGADGQLMKCTVLLDKDEKNVVGQINEDGTLTLDHERMALWTEPAFQRDSQCQKCVVLPACQGVSCPLPRIYEDKRPCVPARTQAKADLLEMLDRPARNVRAVSA